MKKLIYYKIEVKEGIFKESNAVIETAGINMTTDEWHDFNCNARERNDTYHQPIIINMWNMD